MHENREAAIEYSWGANAAAWSKAVREQRIESRRVATDRAIVDAVLAQQPRRVLDVGCGEGWLARALAGHHIEVVGIDVSPGLIEAATAGGGGRFEVLRYSEFAADPRRAGSDYDVVALNFALLAEDITPLLRACGAVAAQDGRVIIQTLHPFAASIDSRYEDGWRTESFSTMGDDFRASMPWYFRTMGSWLNTLRAGELAVEEVREPVHPESGRPLSLLMICSSAP